MSSFVSIQAFVQPRLPCSFASSTVSASWEAALPLSEARPVAVTACRLERTVAVAASAEGEAVIRLEHSHYQISTLKLFGWTLMRSITTRRQRRMKEQRRRISSDEWTYRHRVGRMSLPRNLQTSSPISLRLLRRHLRALKRHAHFRRMGEQNFSFI